MESRRVFFVAQFAKVATNVPQNFQKQSAIDGTWSEYWWNQALAAWFRAKSTTLNCCIILLVLSLKQLDSLAQLELFCEAWRCKLQWSGCHRFFHVHFPKYLPAAICIRGRALTNICAWTKQKAKFDAIWIWVPSECDRVINALEKTCTLCPVQM